MKFWLTREELMDLAKLIQMNWDLWASGGVDEVEIRETLRGKEINALLEWFNKDREKTPKDYSGSIKTLVDLASWCHYWADSLELHLVETRGGEILDYARYFGVSPDHLVRLIISGDRRFSPFASS